MYYDSVFFKKPIDVNPIYEKCMNGDEKILSATDVSMTLDSAFSLYCKYHAEQNKQDPPDAFLQTLSIKGIEHEGDVISTDYPELEPISFDTNEEGFMMALKSMSSGTKAISNFPMFYKPEGMWGFADVLEKKKGDSIWGKHHYVVREIKLASNVKPSHILQGAFYTMLLGKIQEYTPESFYVTNGDDTLEYEYKEYEDILLGAIKQAQKIRNGWMPPAIHGNGQPPWKNYTNDVAIQNDDVSIIPGIGLSKRNSLVDAGYNTMHDVANSSIPELQKVKQIGKKTASSYFNSARALATDTAIKKDTISLPKCDTEIFLDLEGLNEIFDENMNDYLIGALVRHNGEEKYHSFVAENKDERGMLISFVKFLEKQQGYVMYHWHHYEKTHLKMLMNKHGIDAYHILEPHVMIDLYKIATDAYAFPTYSNSIKDVAKWMGFNWRHDDVGAMTSIELYLEYVDNPKANYDKLQRVLDYNEDDCIATRVIKDWLVEHV